jgi:hypothetical protein
MGKASRVKRERKENPRGKRASQSHLLMTLTNEPFQPVRLYYSILDRLRISKKLGNLACITEAPEERCWQWLFQAEAASLRFGAGYEDVPKERRPIILARVYFPTDSRMVLQTNSIERAIGAANFFAPYLGAECTAIRCRIVNRLFAAEEGRREELMKTLDHNVTVIDPREAEAAFAQDFADARTMAATEQIAAERLERRLQRKEDVPLVEDFPLAPEEETPDFAHLRFTLQLRLLRAMEHWRGNTEVTLPALIVRMVEQDPGSLASMFPQTAPERS